MVRLALALPWTGQVGTLKVSERKEREKERGKKGI